MNQKNSVFHFLLIALTFSSCLPSRDSTSYKLSKELHQTKWVIYNTTDSSKADTIEFSFGYLNSREISNLIKYNSDGKKELCEFKVVMDSILFESYSTSPPFINIDFSKCKSKSVLIYNNSQLYYTSLESICEEAKKEHLIGTPILEIRKL